MWHPMQSDPLISQKCLRRTDQEPIEYCQWDLSLGSGLPPECNSENPYRACMLTQVWTRQFSLKSATMIDPTDSYMLRVHSVTHDEVAMASSNWTLESLLMIHSPLESVEMTRHLSSIFHRSFPFANSFLCV